SKHKMVNAAELEYIQQGGAVVETAPANETVNQYPFSWRNLRLVFSYRKLWGIYIGQFAINSTLWFFLTWFPTYLVKYRGLDFIKSGFLASLPFLAAFVGVLGSGL